MAFVFHRVYGILGVYIDCYTYAEIIIETKNTTEKKGKDSV